MGGEKIGLNEYKVMRKDGTTFPAILHSIAKYRDGQPVGLRGIVIDMTETKKLEAQLRQAHKMEAVGTWRVVSPMISTTFSRPSAAMRTCCS